LLMCEQCGLLTSPNEAIDNDLLRQKTLMDKHTEETVQVCKKITFLDAI
jgi:hypothetical protein